ncbi:hypothetical protein AVEN_233629-1, partial [Araneus ventricosus]
IPGLPNHLGSDFAAKHFGSPALGPMLAEVACVQDGICFHPSHLPGPSLGYRWIALDISLLHVREYVRENTGSFPFIYFRVGQKFNINNHTLDPSGLS